MPGFVRRYQFFPGVATLSLIEGVVIVDEPPPGSINGVGSGVVYMVGEFPDVTFGVAVDSSGNVTTKTQPVEVQSSQDAANKVGGFDEFLGDTGNSEGNGYISLNGKLFNRLILGPVNIASAKGARLFRKLATNASATQPTPVVAMQGGTVQAGTQFVSSTSQRVRSAALKSFTALGAYVGNIDGNAVPAGLPAPTQIFSIGLSVPIGGLVRSGGNLVTGTVAALPSWFVPGATVYLAGGEANFPAGPKLIVTAAGTTFTYNETGSNVASANVEYLSLSNFQKAQGGAPVNVGDILVLGVLGGVGANGFNADTYRVEAVTDTGDLVLERQDGSNFTTANWEAGAALVWRIHPFSDADTGNTVYSGVGGYQVPARPLDSTVAAGLELTPSVAQPPATGSTWSPLSGLGMLTMPGGGGGLTFTAAVQGPNAASASALDALYSTALAAVLTEDEPAREVNIVFSSRKSAAIRTAIKQNVDIASGLGIGHVGVISPELSQQTESVILGSADPGVGANRDERIVYCWPGAQTFIAATVGFTNLKGSDGIFHTDGNLDTAADAWMASIMSNLNPENNPAQGAPPVPTVTAGIKGLQRGVSGLNMNDYILFKQNGICALIKDRQSGAWIFQSGVTSSLVPGQTTIARRRFADFLEDSLAVGLLPFAKLPLTDTLRDAELGEVIDFMDQLLSPNDPDFQRIAAYSVDDQSGNTADLAKAGIHVIIVTCDMLTEQDVIVLQANVGAGLVVVQAG